MALKCLSKCVSSARRPGERARVTARPAHSASQRPALPSAHAWQLHVAAILLRPLDRNGRGLCPEELRKLLEGGGGSRDLGAAWRQRMACGRRNLPSSTAAPMIVGLYGRTLGAGRGLTAVPARPLSCAAAPSDRDGGRCWMVAGVCALACDVCGVWCTVHGHGARPQPMRGMRGGAQLWERGARRGRGGPPTGER